MNVNDPGIRNALHALLVEAKGVTSLGPELEQMLEYGVEHPLEAREALDLLTRVVEKLRMRDGALGGETAELVGRAMALRERVRGSVAPTRAGRAHTVHLLSEHNGVACGPVAPTPFFHEKAIPVIGGFIKTADIKLWGNNERLEIHVGQFRAKNGRPPSPDELLSIMLGKTQMQGINKDDEFEILELARSIAANGVRKPPIIDIDGTLLDGNRRVAACSLILADTEEFGSVQEKKRAEYIYVWQLTPHADEDDRQKVIVSLNFESDHKKQWPEYIKARKVAQEWEGMLALEPRRPGKERQAVMRKDLAKKYALGPDKPVTRYLRMVRWAQEFEEYQINERKRDKFAVQHASNRHWEYFDELSKGEQKPGGVGYILNEDEKFKGIVFDLLFDGKIESWKQVRALKEVYKLDEARDILAKAHAEADVDTAQGHVESAIDIANLKRAETRSLGANLRIETFTKWLEDVPPKALRDEVKPENLQRLLDALMLVEKIVEMGLSVKGVTPSTAAGRWTA